MSFGIGLSVRVVARNPCPIHSIVDECPEGLVGIYESPHDLMTNQFPGWQINSIFGVAQSVKNTSGTSVSLSTGSVATSLTIVAGSGSNAASVADYALTAPIGGSSGSVSGTVSFTPPSSGTSGTFTVSGTITNTTGGNVSYAEVGLQVTSNSNNFLLAHDVFGSAYNVSNNGTLQVTYTGTYS